MKKIIVLWLSLVAMVSQAQIESMEGRMELEAAQLLFNTIPQERRLSSGELPVYDVLIKHFKNSRYLEIQSIVTQAMINKGDILSQLGRHEEVINAMDEGIKRFSDIQYIDIKAFIAEAMVKKGFALIALKRYEEALAIFDEMVERFRDDSSLARTRENVVVAMKAKGDILEQLGRHQEALVAYEASLEKFEELKAHYELLKQFSSDEFGLADFPIEEIMKKIEDAKNSQ